MGFYLKIESRPSNNLENEGQGHCQGQSLYIQQFLF